MAISDLEPQRPETGGLGPRIELEVRRRKPELNCEGRSGDLAGPSPRGRDQAVHALGVVGGGELGRPGREEGKDGE